MTLPPPQHIPAAGGPALLKAAARLRRWFPVVLRDNPADEAAALVRFGSLVREARPLSELRLALVYLAQQLSGASRAELLLMCPVPGGARPRVVAQWPSPDRRTGDPLGPPINLPLRIQGLNCGLLRILPNARSRRLPAAAPALDGLRALAALAAAVELAQRHRPGIGHTAYPPIADDSPPPRL